MKKYSPKRPMTIEELARMTQAEFVGVRKEMNEGFLSMRSDMTTLRDELRSELATKHELHDGFDAMALVLRAIREDIKALRQETVVEIIDLKDRVSRIERKLGMASQ